MSYQQLKALSGERCCRLLRWSVDAVLNSLHFHKIGKDWEFGSAKSRKNSPTKVWTHQGESLEKVQSTQFKVYIILAIQVWIMRMNVMKNQPDVLKENAQQSIYECVRSFFVLSKAQLIPFVILLKGEHIFLHSLDIIFRDQK